MDPDSTNFIDTSFIILSIILLILMFLSAFFSSAETAFSSTNKIRIRSLSEEGNKRADIVLKILDSYSKLISTILIGNNVVNITASAIATTLAAKTGLSFAVSFSTGLLTVLVLIFGEIVPKTWANLYADSIAMTYAPIIRFLMIVLTPVIFVVDHLSHAILKLFRIDPNKKNNSMTESELRTIVEASHEEGVIEEKEREMIYNVFDFGDALARDIMIPRIDMVTVEDTATYDEVMEVFRENMYTRIPIYHENSDNIIGVINVKDFLFVKPEEFSIPNILRDIYYTYEYKKTSDLLMELRKNSYTIAMVLNEYGSCEGMITMEDLLEEIVGEIRDEYDEDEETLIQQVEDNIYLVPGGMKLDDINDAISTDFDSEDYDSIGGLVIEKLDRLPEEGESVELEDGSIIQVLTINQNRIEQVKLILKKSSAESDGKDNTEEILPDNG